MSTPLALESSGATDYPGWGQQASGSCPLGARLGAMPGPPVPVPAPPEPEQLGHSPCLLPQQQLPCCRSSQKVPVHSSVKQMEQDLATVLAAEASAPRKEFPVEYISSNRMYCL